LTGVLNSADMQLGLEDKLVLVKGSTNGIGESIAKAFATAGAKVIINGRSKENVDKVVEAMKKDDRKVFGVCGDVSTAEGTASVTEQISKIGELDVLVCNVGIFETKAFEDIADEDWLQYFNVNVMSTVRLSRFYLPKMLKRSKVDEKWFGRIIFIASEAGIKPIPNMVHYSMTKSAIIGLARGLAETTKGTSVTVNSILAGPTWTEGVEKYFEGLAKVEKVPLKTMVNDYFTKYDGSASLIQRFLKPEEVANTVLFVGSAAASAVNGAAQRAEGGLIRSL